MTSAGGSVDWDKSKKNHKRIGTCFLAHAQNSAWGLIWDEVPEAELNQMDFWGSFATYLVEIYQIEKGSVNVGKALASNSAAGVWGGLIEDMKFRFSSSTSPQTKVRTPPRTHATHTHAAHASTRCPVDRPSAARRVRRSSSSARQGTSAPRPSGTSR